VRPPMPLMRQMGEVGQALDGPDDDVSSAAAIAAVGPAAGSVLLATETHATVASGPPAHIDSHAIDEHAGFTLGRAVAPSDACGAIGEGEASRKGEATREGEAPSEPFLHAGSHGGPPYRGPPCCLTRLSSATGWEPPAAR